MKPDVDSQVPVADVPSQAEPFGEPVGTLLGWYTTAQGRRHVRAIATAESGLCVIDDGAGGTLLVEPRLEGMAEVRALVADYLSLASERGEPQTLHPWSADAGSGVRKQSCAADSPSASPSGKRSQRGDEAELFAGYNAHLERIVKTVTSAASETVEDACSFAWVQLLQRQPERENILAWLRVVAVHEVYRLWRKAGSEVPTEVAANGDRAVEGFDSGAQRAQLLAVLQAMEALPDRRRRIFQLHVAGLKYAEISAATGEGPRAIDRQIKKARDSLRRDFGNAEAKG
jgi:RNA polymerase sigma factor (sigma-70 family)